MVHVLTLMVCACSSSSKTENNSSDSDGGDLTPSIGDPNTLVGTFQVRLVAPVPVTATEPESAGYTGVLGKVYDGPTPSQIIWEEFLFDGDCKLLKPRIPFCSTGCGSAVCVEDGQCQAYPASQSVGTVHTTGLRTESGGTEFSMEPVANSYQPSETLPYPAFMENDDILFEASGSTFTSPFSLQAKGISQLEVLNEALPIEEDQPLNLLWTPPGVAGLAQIHVKLDVSHHGGSKGKIECDTEDTGALVLSASILKQLTDLGVAGFPTIVVTRSSKGSTTISAGRVDLVVSSDVEIAVQIPGLTSCTKDEDCPDDETCQTALVCR